MKSMWSQSTDKDTIIMNRSYATIFPDNTPNGRRKLGILSTNLSYQTKQITKSKLCNKVYDIIDKYGIHKFVEKSFGIMIENVKLEVMSLPTYLSHKDQIIVAKTQAMTSFCVNSMIDEQIISQLISQTQINLDTLVHIVPKKCVIYLYQPLILQDACAPTTIQTAVRWAIVL